MTAKMLKLLLRQVAEGMASADAAFRVVHGECASCGLLASLEMVDEEHAVCPLCSSTNTYVIVDLEDGDAVAVTGS